MKPQDRWAEDKETWVGRSHLCSYINRKTKTGGGLQISLRGVPDLSESSLLQIGHKTSLTKLVTIPPIKSTSQIPPLARWIIVSRNLKEEAKDEPALGWDMKLSICSHKNISWYVELGRVGVLLLYYYIGPYGQSFEAQIHMRFFTRTVVHPHKKRVRSVSRREGGEALTESATSETLTSVWNYFRVSTCKRFFRVWYGWQFVDGVICGGFCSRV